MEIFPSFKQRGRRETAGEEKEERTETTGAESGRQDNLNNSNHKASKTIDTSKSSSGDKTLSKVFWKKQVKQCVILGNK